MRKLVGWNLGNNESVAQHFVDRYLGERITGEAVSQPLPIRIRRDKYRDTRNFALFLIASSREKPSCASRPNAILALRLVLGDVKKSPQYLLIIELRIGWLNQDNPLSS